MKSELTELKRRWLAKVGSVMPEDVQRLPLEKIRFAVDAVERGDTVCVPSVRVSREEQQDENSMMPWDAHGQF